MIDNLRRHLQRYGILMLALVVFSASTLLTFQRIKAAYEETRTISGTSVWLTTQAEFELQRLIHALDRYALGDPTMTGDTLITRFEIFWSRLPILVQGSEGAPVVKLTEAEEVVPAILASLERLEPTLRALGREGDAYGRLRAELAGFQEPLRQLTMQVQDELSHSHNIFDLRMQRAYAGHVLFLLGMVASAVTFIALLVRETWRSRGLLAEASAAQAHAAHLAHHDPLTGLPNRLLFHDRLDQALENGRRYGRRFGLIALDIDHFKPINDAFGHVAGDAVLRAVAERIQACMRASDTFARLGGDEFAIVQRDIGGIQDVEALAGRVLEALGPPITLEHGQLAVAVSLGAALFPEHGREVDRLLRRADLALYRAKAEGRGRSCIYARPMEAEAHALERSAAQRSVA